MSATDPRAQASSWPEFVDALGERLERAFAALEHELCASSEQHSARARPDTWSTLEIGEHVALANHYLLILVDKIALKARTRSAAATPALPRTQHIERIASRAFAWLSPAHMLPSGALDAAQVRARLAAQRARVQALLQQHRSGEGTRHRIRMSVVGEDDRLDLYQFLLVIALHAERHLAQIERVRTHCDQREAR